MSRDRNAAAAGDSNSISQSSTMTNCVASSNEAMQTVTKMGRLKMQDVKMTDQIAGHQIAGH